MDRIMDHASLMRMTKAELLKKCADMGIKKCASKSKAAIVGLILGAGGPTHVELLQRYLDMSKTNHKEKIMELKTLKDAHIYCILNCTSQQYGPLLEGFILERLGYTKRKAEECAGDCSDGDTNIEIKASLGGATRIKFNYVQLRPSHMCDYILTAYHLAQENVHIGGELYVFKVPSVDMKTLIVEHGGYAHGTIKKQGPITGESIDRLKNAEYAIRPTIGDKCWTRLLAFRVD